jgi:ribosomal-protein-alanine acetyltransferase
MGADDASARSDLVVRPVASVDLSVVHQILAEAPEAATWSANALEEAARSNSQHFLVAQTNDEVSGFVLGRRIGEEGEVLNLVVNPTCRRAGIATALMRKLLEAFAQEGAKAVFLEVRQSNCGAITFYEGLGFSEITKRPRYYSSPTEDALVMRFTGPALHTVKC